VVSCRFVREATPDQSSEVPARTEPWIPVGQAAGGGARGAPTPRTRRDLALLSLGALGVVYGDIGTSPLYALRECFGGHHALEPTRANVLGVLSLIFWSLVLVVAVKYLAFVLRADNRGEGGGFALMALVGQHDLSRKGRAALLVLGLFGASLLYGEGVITPAISVLGAVEGVAVAAPALDNLITPIAVAILAVLFAVQRKGTGAVARVFGPVMLVWFLSIGALGVAGLVEDPEVLWAVDPRQAVAFGVENGITAFLVLGGVVLVITGCEALYADMGHFGRRPIRLAWFAVAMPALVLNYFGQGALLLRDPAAIANPFYLLAPGWALYPLIGLATAAAVVASQALISGAFSLTSQAVQLDYCPRVTVRHTSSTEHGQIYVPEVNWLVGVACIALTIGFQRSAGLAAAYGIAVTGTMSITSLLFYRVLRDRWSWSRWAALPLVIAFLTVDLGFFGANIVKFSDGGWFPVAAALVAFALLSTWKRGRSALAAQLKDAGLPLSLFLDDVARRAPLRVPGTAVFMTSHPGAAPPVLLHHLKHIKVLHERVVFVSIITDDVPSVPDVERVEARDLGNGFFQVVAHFGFMERPSVPALFASLPDREGTPPGLELKPHETTFFLGRETLLPSGRSPLARWRKKLFIVMARNATTASAFFGLPPNRVVELGAQIQL
jgi:KUP system potassium uptake protein